MMISFSIGRSCCKGGLLFALFAATSFNPALGDSVSRLSSMPAQLGDISLSGNRLLATKEGSLCIFSYADEPFSVVELGCIESDEYEFRTSRWSASGEQFAISRRSQRTGEGSVVVYRNDSSAGRFEEVWTSALDDHFPQVDSFSIEAWADERTVLVSTGCGSSCIAMSLINSDGYESEPVTLGIDYSPKWSDAGTSLQGVDRAGKLFRMEVDLTDPAKPGLKQADYFDGCLGDSGWFAGDENRFWQRFEAQLDADRALLSKQPCNEGVTFNFGTHENFVADRDLVIMEQVSLGSPIAVSNDKQRIASVKEIDGKYHLTISDSRNLSSISEVELVNFRPDASSIDNLYDSYTPVWSPDDAYILVPKSPISGGAVVIDASRPDRVAAELPDSTGRFGFYWLSNNKLIAKNLSDLDVYAVVP